MSLAPLLSAPLAVQLHVYTVVPAALIGGYMLLARKGTPVHRLLGRIWIVLMITTALASFFIHELNLFADFSPIHFLSVLTLVGCVQAVRLARARRIKEHMRMVRSLYFGGIGIAGLFTLLPGRIMNRMIFGDGGSWMAWLRPSEAGSVWLFVTIGIVAAVLLAGFNLKRRQGQS